MWSLWCKTNVNTENENDTEITKVTSEDYFFVEEEEGNNISNLNDSQYLLAKIDLNDRLHKKELEFKDRQIAQKESKIKEITARLQQCDREKATSCADLKERLTKIESELAKAKALCNEQKDALEQYKIDSSRKTEEISTLTKTLEDTEKQYKETVKRLTQELSESHQKIESLECSSFEPENKKFDSQVEPKKLLQDLNKARQALSSKDRELQEALAKKNSLDSSLKQLQANKDKVEREYDWSRKHHQTMLNQANTSLKEKTEEIDRLSSEINQLKQQVEKEKVTTQDEIQRLLLEIDGKDLALNSAQSELQQIRKELNSKQHKGKRR